MASLCELYMNQWFISLISKSAYSVIFQDFNVFCCLYFPEFQTNRAKA